MAFKDRAWHQAEIKKNQRRMAKNAIRSMAKGAEKNVLKRLGKQWSAADIKKMRKELDAETPHERSMRMPAGRSTMSSWSNRWRSGGLDKTFRSKNYGGGMWIENRGTPKEVEYRMRPGEKGRSYWDWTTGTYRYG